MSTGQVYRTVQLVEKTNYGKRITPHRVDAIDDNKGSKRLYAFDKKPRLNFLIDTGSDISLIPHVGKPNTPPSNITLFAANNTRIATYGNKHLNLNLGLRRDLNWKFLVADVPYPIIGPDLLSHFGILVDLKERKIIDSLTNLRVNGILKCAEICSISVIDRTSEYAKLLEEFPEITKLQQSTNTSIRDTVHYIITKGQPIAQN